MITEENKIRFNTADRRASIKNRRSLKQFLAAKIGSAGFQLSSLDFVFCSDEYLLQINRAHLKHDDYTDIITFDLADIPGHIHGEIYISIDRVKENAKIYRASTTRELHRVIFHGVLHLLGFRDKTPEDREVMRSMEEQYLREYIASKSD